MKDPRTLTNTPKREIEDVALEVRSRREWLRLKREGLLKSIRCANCDTAFQPTRQWQKFCSARCQTESFRKAKEREEAALLAEIADLRQEVLRLRLRITELEAKK